MKPNFLCVGNVKAGSTSLWSTLKQHSNIFMPETKEIHFFDWNYDKGFEWYENYFKNVTDEKIVGEVTPNYMYRDIFLNRIYKHFDNLKVLILIRNPIERAISHHQMFHKDKNIEPESNILLSKNKDFYLEKGKYYQRILELQKKYDVLCIQTENLDNSYNKIQKWLDVNVEDLPPARVMVNESKFNVPLETKEFLLNYFQEEIENLESHLGWNLNDYKTVT